MNRYNQYSREDDYMQQKKKQINETQVDYTLTGALN